jgi:fatty acid desaturase
MGMGVESPGTFAAVTALENMARKPVAHLTFADVEAIGRELDHIRMSVLESRGERDAAYIRRVIDAQRKLEMAGRVLLLASRYRPAWVLGTACLAVAKILDNMEIGHNVLHGQWDWMRDPKIHSSTWEWDHASPAEQWKRAHNVQHHTFTNILGKDNDLGYGIMRVAEEQPWKPRYLVQPLWNFLNACIFEYGVAMYDMEIGDHLRQKRGLTPELRSRIEQTLHKVGRQATKDYILFPALSGPSWRSTVAANVTANVVRNIWSHSVIMCGHFPEGVETFEQESLPQTESKGEWYLRQMLGSANISGSKAMHLMSGHLSHQIEHHLFPDLPSRRYQEIAPAVREVFHRYGLTYHAAPLATQVGSAWHKVVRLSLPNGWLKETTVRNAPAQIAKLFRSETTAPLQKQTIRPTALIAASL